MNLLFQHLPLDSVYWIFRQFVALLRCWLINLTSFVGRFHAGSAWHVCIFNIGLPEVAKTSKFSLAIKCDEFVEINLRREAVSGWRVTIGADGGREVVSDIGHVRHRRMCDFSRLGDILRGWPHDDVVQTMYSRRSLELDTWWYLINVQ